MSITVGIPQALLYYKYYPLWEGFLGGLGLEVVTSPATNRRILTAGVEAADNEICLPVKVFYGHVLSLKEKVDLLFIPRVVSVEEDAYTCPKFLGLPDMIRAVGDMPEVLDPIFNFRLGSRRVSRDVYSFAKRFTKHPAKVWRAWRHGVDEQRRYVAKLESGWTPVEVLSGKAPPEAKGDMTIGVVGHPYNIHDEYVSMNLVKRLRKMGARVVTSDMLPHRVVEAEANRLPKKLFWTYEKEIVGSAFYWMRSGTVDGMIYMLSFACGPDSLIQVLLEQEAKREGAPALMPLVIDEHSGEAGLVTRVEAFVDMLAWRLN
ncbi:MAG: acyl-CoA dehydratase activase-related protein [Actinobacteria bacterium]|nr:acyl-CoA dehydratase activase-related protein [Actinomycetota bacterium]